MNTLQNKTRRYVGLFLFVVCESLCGLALYGGDLKMDGILHLNLNHVGNQADLILTGNLEPVASPYEVLGKDFYRIKALEVLKGRMPTDCLLVVWRRLLSSEGIAPSIETNVSYMLFLEEVKCDDKAAPKDMVFYRLVDNWKGIISLDANATERRAVESLDRDYGINVHERLADFKEAMRYSLKEQGARVTKEDLHFGAFAVYEGLKLERAAESTSNP